MLLKQNTKVNDRTTVMWNAKNYDRDLDFIIENGSLKIDFQNNTDEFDIQPTFTLEDPFPATTTVRDYFEIRNVNLLSIRSTHFNLRGTGRFEANNTTYIYLGTALSSPNNTKPVTIFDSSSMVLNSSSIISLNSVSVVSDNKVAALSCITQTVIIEQTFITSGESKVRMRAEELIFDSSGVPSLMACKQNSQTTLNLGAIVLNTGTFQVSDNSILTLNSINSTPLFDFDSNVYPKKMFDFILNSPTAKDNKATIYFSAVVFNAFILSDLISKLVITVNGDDAYLKVQQFKYTNEGKNKFSLSIEFYKT
ncbi:hypothetical protein PS870_00499 [Pseudomonas fluorescens]|uniref:Uncharacterized protein n=1 Tax=Pseudomonas fluorescens TaxID=294 RepID=A0A5E7GTK8_PSEFL|nr:hypothetical protein PS870_00499 [Pseudomonas fluorescens]